MQAPHPLEDSYPHSYHLLKPIEKLCQKQDTGSSQVTLPAAVFPNPLLGSLHLWSVSHRPPTRTLVQYLKFIRQRNLRACNAVKQKAVNVTARLCSVTCIFTSRVTDCVACFYTPAALSTLLVAVPKPLWFERCPPSLPAPILTACRGGTGLRCNPADLVSITAQEQLTTLLLKCEKEQQPPLYRRATDPCLSVRAGFRLPSASSPGALAGSPCA